MITPKAKKKRFSLNEKEDVKKFANREEKVIARQMPASGATPFMPGDIVFGSSVIDVKSTKKGRVIVTEEMLAKLEADSRTHSKKPVLLLNFCMAKKLRHRKWIVIPYAD